MPHREDEVFWRLLSTASIASSMENAAMKRALFFAIPRYPDAADALAVRVTKGIRLH
jgi:hypothetical protein